MREKERKCVCVRERERERDSERQTQDRFSACAREVSIFGCCSYYDPGIMQEFCPGNKAKISSLSVRMYNYDLFLLISNCTLCQRVQFGQLLECQE